MIPPTHYVMAAPGVSQIDEAIWKNAMAFEPQRWLDRPAETEEGEKVDYGFGAISSGTNSPFLPFGAGRHRCIGEQFAYLQLAAVVTTVLRHCDLKLASSEFPAPDYTVSGGDVGFCFTGFAVQELIFDLIWFWYLMGCFGGLVCRPCWFAPGSREM